MRFAETANLSRLDSSYKERKHRPFAEDALYLDPSAMNLRDVLNDSEAESRSTHLPATALVHPVESFKESGQVLLINPRTRVKNRDLNHVVYFLSTNCYYNTRL